MNVSQARSELATAEARIASTEAEIEELRELLATGEPGAEHELGKTVKRLARETEILANHRAACRVAERREEEEDTRVADEAARVGRELRRLAAAKHSAKLASFIVFIRGVAADLAEYDADLRRLDDQAGGHRGLVPSSLISFRQLTSVLAQVIRQVDPPRTTSSQEG